MSFLPPRFRACLAVFVACAACTMGVDAQEPVVGTPEDARDLLFRGDYEAAQATARVGREVDPREERWWRIEAEALFAIGRYEEAYANLRESLGSNYSSLRLRLLAAEIAPFAGHGAAVTELQTELRFVVLSQRRYIPDLETLVAYGEAALALGAEPKLVLENFFRRGREETPAVRDAFLATGRLALTKHDDALASRSFREGIAAFPNDPDMWAGLAASFLDGDRNRLVEYARHALTLNNAHIPALLLLTEHAIDAQDHEAAAETLDAVSEINPRHPEALALRAVLAHLANDLESAEAFREAALSTSSQNPGVDHVIGRKLSQNYRFAEGAAHQRRALAFDEGFNPAVMQLAQDLLRLGETTEAEGWKLAAQAHEADAYDVAAFNLTNLHDRIQSYTTIESPHFHLRMGADEAPIYGDRALALLERARERLAARYGLALEDKITIEIHPNPKDFAVRTFGMPDKPGYLGVCFGPLVTINSPATRQANWEAVLWHEFAHVVTLTLTRNRMPRWLSEGISVFEEHEENPHWRRAMSLDYRERILTERMQPISEMSAAFLEAKDGEDLQFAYFQSGLVVEFLIQGYGFEHLRQILADLGDGMEINAALEANFALTRELDAAFADHATTLARELGKGWDLTPPTDAMSTAIALFNPRSFHGQITQIKTAIGEGRHEDARDALLEITDDGVYLPGDENLHAMLASVCQELGDTETEALALETILQNQADSLQAAVRLLDIATQSGDTAAMKKWANAWLAINPLAQAPWRTLLDAHEQTGEEQEAVRAGIVVLALDPPDRPALHYRLAGLQRESDPAAARRHVLLALEEAPRFRAAHQLLATLPRP